MIWIADKVYSFFVGLLITAVFLVVLIGLGSGVVWIYERLVEIRTFEDVFKGLVVIFVLAYTLFMQWYIGHLWRHDKI